MLIALVTTLAAAGGPTRHKAVRANPAHKIATRAKGSLVGLFSSDDYPKDALQKRDTGTVGVTLMIGTDGRVSDCRVTLSSLSPSLDAATCRIITDRAGFAPALDRAGRPVTDRYLQRITWALPTPEPEKVANSGSRSLIVEHANGHAECKMWVDKIELPIDATTCEKWRSQAKHESERLPMAVSSPYRATLSLDKLVGDGVPIVANPAMTIRGAARLRIDAAGRVSGCQPIAEALLNGDGALDMCSRIDEVRFEALPSTIKDRGDRAMVILRTVVFEAGDGGG